MVRIGLIIALLLAVCVSAEAQFGGRKFGQGNFGNFQFGIQKFEHSVTGSSPVTGVMDTDNNVVTDTSDNIVTDTN